MQFQKFKVSSTDNPSVKVWCWRFKDGNNKTLAYSAHHFSTEEECDADIRVLIAIDDSVSIVSVVDKEPNMMSQFLEKLFAQSQKIGKKI